MISIGIRELRQRASRYIALVRGGRTIEVTDRGRPVALLVPIPRGSEIERLGAEGRLSPDGGDLLELGSPVAPAPGESLPSKVLEEMRVDER
jgi:prevent-host-death family protein